jgi:hypothetical protein
MYVAFKSLVPPHYFHPQNSVRNSIRQFPWNGNEDDPLGSRSASRERSPEPVGRRDTDEGGDDVNDPRLSAALGQPLGDSSMQNIHGAGAAAGNAGLDGATDNSVNSPSSAGGNGNNESSNAAEDSNDANGNANGNAGGAENGSTNAHTNVNTNADTIHCTTGETANTQDQPAGSLIGTTSADNEVLIVGQPVGEADKASNNPNSNNDNNPNGNNGHQIAVGSASNANISVNGGAGNSSTVDHNHSVNHNPSVNHLATANTVNHLTSENLPADRHLTSNLSLSPEVPDFNFAVHRASTCFVAKDARGVVSRVPSAVEAQGKLGQENIGNQNSSTRNFKMSAMIQNTNSISNL